MADSIVGNTEMGASKQDLIAAAVQRELKFRAKLLPTVMDVSQFAQPGQKSIEFPKLSSFTAAKSVEGSRGDSNVLTATTDSMALSENAYVAWIIDATSQLQSRIDAQVEYARRAASAHGRVVDEDIISAIGAGASLSVNGGTAADVTKSDVLAMREHVLLGNAIFEDLVFLVSVTAETALLDIAEFSKNDVYGSPVIQTGQIGTLYGIPVIRHNGVEDQQVILYEKSALAIGFQKAPTFSEQGANEYGSGAMRNALDQLYGLQIMQDGVGGASANQSPLIAVLNDPS